MRTGTDKQQTPSLELWHRWGGGLLQPQPPPSGPGAPQGEFLIGSERRLEGTQSGPLSPRIRTRGPLQSSKEVVSGQIKGAGQGTNLLLIKYTSRFWLGL